MELANTRIVPASPAVVWAALNDPAILSACLPGCESFERTGDDQYQVVMNARVGPVSARFTGNMTMADIDAPNGYTLRFQGQGGAAGFARGEAQVQLARAGEQHTSLTYAAKAQVGGKLAQIGSRLVDGAAAKLVDDFFARFTERLAPTAPGVAGTATTPGGAPVAIEPVSGEPAGAKGEPAMAADRRRFRDATQIAPPGGAAWIRYAAIVAIAIVVILLYARGYR
jgi:carbon monoxide dehydrogenase subunit G